MVTKLAFPVVLFSMLETINRTIEQRLSPQSVQWRIEAWRTGLPFSQVVMRHTLHYRVEQVFLIDEETGLPLQHIVAGFTRRHGGYPRHDSPPV